MLIKLEILVEVNDDHMKFMYKGDPRNWPQIILDQISNMEDCDFSVIVAEAEEINELAK